MKGQHNIRCLLLSIRVNTDIIISYQMEKVIYKKMSVINTRKDTSDVPDLITIPSSFSYLSVER